MQNNNDNQRECPPSPEPSRNTVIARGVARTGHKRLAAVMVECPEFFAWQRIPEPPRERVMTTNSDGKEKGIST